ncbi:hypothetical protein CDAR_497881 [Caerostris darwini]|uniref:Uncharacterized protein n=1 Tax=Caerostris darwini TaxID=1538125 RepID=A0AAV4TD37_9ARAC|nr:hypothetical protein CDAR_497881 [Caerostris darwini]
MLLMKVGLPCALGAQSLVTWEWKQLPASHFSKSQSIISPFSSINGFGDVVKALFSLLRGEVYLYRHLIREGGLRSIKLIIMTFIVVGMNTFDLKALAFE